MPAAIEQLETLDIRLQSLLEPTPTLTGIARERLHAQLPRLPHDLGPEQLWVGEHTLAHSLERFWQDQGLPDPQADCYYLANHERHPLPRTYTPLLIRWIRLLGSETLTLYTDALKRFWLSRKAELRSIQIQQLRAEVALRLQDGTLPANAGQLLTLLFKHPDALSREALPPLRRPGVYRLSLRTDADEIILNGSFVLTQRNARGYHDPHGAFAVPLIGPPQTVAPASDSGVVLLYSRGVGLEAFDSLGALHQELAERLDDQRQGALLLSGLTGQERRAVQNPDELLITEMHQDAFTLGVEQLLRGQRQAVFEAWRGVQHPAAQRTLSRYERALTRAAALLPLIDRHGRLRTRYGALLENYMPAWLKSASQEAKVEIVQAMQALALATAKAATPGLPSVRTFGARSSLLAYAKAQLRRPLHALSGQELNPDHLFIVTTTAYQTGPLTPATNPGHIIPGWLRAHTGEIVNLQSRKRSLTELALENIGALDFDYWLTARVFDQQNQPVPGVTPTAVKQLMRRLNIGSRYASHIKHRLIDAPEAQWRRDSHYRLTLTRLRAEALKARHAGHLGSDREERAYFWIDTLLRHPSRTSRPTVYGHSLEVQTLELAGARITGVLVLSVRSPDSVASLVLYTPDAPDRRPWRYFRDRAALLAAFTGQAALSAYALERINIASRDAARRLLESGHAATSVKLGVIEGDFIEQCYLAEVDRVMTDSDALSTTTSEINLETLWHTALSVLDMITLILPGRLLVPLALGRAMISLWDAKESLQAADRIEGLRHLLLMLTYLGDAGAGIAACSFFSRTFRHLPIKQPAPLNPNLAATSPSRNLRYRIDSIYKEGVYEHVPAEGGQSRYFIEDKAGRRYEVDFDGQAWLVVDARNPNAYFKSLVRRNAAGEWVLPQDVRWDGAVPDLAELVAQVRMDSEQTPGASPDGHGIIRQNGLLYLRWGAHTFRIQRSLRDNRYRLMPAGEKSKDATILVRRNLSDDGWEIKVRQTGLASEWLEFAALA
ncbi:DUF6543 domain-containing protein [Pseudomonas sp. dw_358]|uniref:dermonecrotic toxin domain-containing protein n=1 Tax=Pseudomonas sp. dw_358 TaxID=2720083 RepID=UPI001BD29143|nr:DUF6543 domain-containing protein [Pseudomonas sp. dw_358]